jgi:hypothetical protein
MSYDAERIASLLHALPPAPGAWVLAAQELPVVRRGLHDIIERARADAEFRARLVGDLEAALAAEGYELDPALMARLRVDLDR